MEADEQQDSSGGGSGNCNLTQLTGPDGPRRSGSCPGRESRPLCAPEQEVLCFSLDGAQGLFSPAWLNPVCI